jgi:hypothetical protein
MQRLGLFLDFADDGLWNAIGRESAETYRSAIVNHCSPLGCR